MIEYLTYRKEIKIEDVGIAKYIFYVIVGLLSHIPYLGLFWIFVPEAEEIKYEFICNLNGIFTGINLNSKKNKIYGIKISQIKKIYFLINSYSNNKLIIKSYLGEENDLILPFGTFEEALLIKEVLYRNNLKIEGYKVSPWITFAFSSILLFVFFIVYIVYFG